MFYAESCRQLASSTFATASPRQCQRGDPLAGDGESRSREVDGLAPFFPIEHPQKPAAVPLNKSAARDSLSRLPCDTFSKAAD
jgi:hypothetical protein